MFRLFLAALLLFSQIPSFTYCISSSMRNASHPYSLQQQELDKKLVVAIAVATVVTFGAGAYTITKQSYLAIKYCIQRALGKVKPSEPSEAEQLAKILALLEEIKQSKQLA